MWNRKSITGRTVVGYGASQALMANLRCGGIPLSYIVDDNAELHGKTIDGIEICPPSKLKREDGGECFVILFAYLSSTISHMSRYLDSLGFEYSRNYIDCSVFQYESLRSTIESTFGMRVEYDTFFKIRMLSLYSGMQNNSFAAGTWLYVELLKYVLNVSDGDVVECGVYNGVNAFIALLMLPELCRRKYHLYDSFEGFPDICHHDPLNSRGEFRDVDYRRVSQLFSNYHNVVIHKGYFENTFVKNSADKYAMVYVDCDLYESTKRCCEHYYNRVQSGGIILFHDYWGCGHIPEYDLGLYGGVKKAVDEYFMRTGDKIIVFPETSHALVIKG